MFISIIILLLYTSLIEETKTVRVEKISLTKYKHLESLYREALRCPCPNISINYGKLFDIEYTLHQVCSSIFVDTNWINNFITPDKTKLLLDDFRWTSRFTFQGLKTFCDISNRTISHELDRFYSNQYISATLVRPNSFDSETKALIKQFRTSMIDNFLLFLSIIRETTQANALFSILKSSYRAFLPEGFEVVQTIPKTFGDCSCGSSSKCVQPIVIFINGNRTNNFSVPNFYEGCYVIEALLQSRLTCFYDQHCIDKLQLDFTSSPPMFTPALNEDNFSNSTVQEIVNNFMIDHWNTSSPFEKYYNECHPQECTYKLQTRNDLIYIATTLFGIAGGLTTTLKLIVPRCINLIAYIIRKRNPQISVVET